MKRFSKSMAIVASSVSVITLLAGCGTSVSNSSNKQSFTVWDVQTGPLQTIFKTATNDFNKAHPDTFANLQFYSNGAYKQKIQIAMGANNSPDIIYGWGGGILKTYVDAHKVLPLDDFLKKNPQYKDKFFPSIWGNVTFGGHIYGVPEGAGTQPELLYYNKSIFQKYNIPVPATWDQLVSDVKTLKSHGVTPISIGARDEWPDLMWLMYLTDRIGGPKVFQGILNKNKDAWDNPAILQSLQMIQQLVKAGAFEKGYSGVSADDNEDQALLYSGKAAMLLQGTWVFPSIQASAPAFTKSDLAWTEFPSVSHGVGNKADLMGNISNYYYISSKSKSVKAEEEYLKDVPFNQYEVKQDIKNGVIPPVKGIESEFAHAQNSQFLKDVYNIAENAPVFVTGWDQLLPPTEAQVLLKNLSSLFELQTTPQQFVSNMNAALAGQ